MGKTKSYLTFKIGTETFAANVEGIQNIIEYPKITKVPEMPIYILGVTNLRGEVLPVIDSRLKFGISAINITSNTCIIVFEMTDDGIKLKVGLLVDEVCEVLEKDDVDIKEPPSLGLKIRVDVITGVFPAGEKFVMLLDINKVIASDGILNAQEHNF